MTRFDAHIARRHLNGHDSGRIEVDLAVLHIEVRHSGRWKPGVTVCVHDVKARREGRRAAGASRPNRDAAGSLTPIPGANRNRFRRSTGGGDGEELELELLVCLHKVDRSSVVAERRGYGEPRALIEADRVIGGPIDQVQVVALRARPVHRERLSVGAQARVRL